ncbi:hypothetical protein [Marinilactibacillus piezotolerans]|uniref:hypothetical protein n=1 Tax=Marinilactibacillus piezotolerans TaxID=258723 RepID=UPI0009B053CD|nr:hypothetical protein [Marinilactibacillus piezotolerans]
MKKLFHSIFSERSIFLTIGGLLVIIGIGLFLTDLFELWTVFRVFGSGIILLVFGGFERTALHFLEKSADQHMYDERYHYQMMQADAKMRPFATRGIPLIIILFLILDVSVIPIIILFVYLAIGQIYYIQNVSKYTV